jgi:hypothetical protein
MTVGWHESIPRDDTRGVIPDGIRLGRLQLAERPAADGCVGADADGVAPARILAARQWIAGERQRITSDRDADEL